MSAASVKNVFPLAVHTVGYILYVRNSPNWQHQLCEMCQGGRKECELQGKSFTKPFSLTLAALFPTSELCLLSHVLQFSLSQVVYIFPLNPSLAQRGEKSGSHA